MFRTKDQKTLLLVAIIVVLLLSTVSGCASTKTANTTPSGAPAIDYPTKDITFIVPVSPGGGFDIYARMLAQYMPKYLPKQVNMIVKNVTGGEWNIGIGEINRAKPDGYTIGIFNIPGNTVNQILGADYDLNKMTWIGRLTDEFYVGSLSPKSKFKSLKDMQNGDEVKVGVVGLSSTGGLGALIALQELGIKAKFVPHPGSTEAIMAAIRGDVDYVQYNYQAVKNFIVDSHQLTPVVVFLPERVKTLPDVATIKELGHESLLNVVRLNYFIGGTPGIPPEVAQILRDAFQKTLKDPEFIKKMEETSGQVVNPASELEAAKQVEETLNTFGKYKELVKSAKK